MNLLEVSRNIVHADGGDGDDHTLCGVTAENQISDMSEYEGEHDTELCPVMLKTRQKITCPECAAIIRYCCALGTKSLGKVREFGDGDFY